jgi:hypothetical protein
MYPKPENIARGREYLIKIGWKKIYPVEKNKKYILKSRRKNGQYLLLAVLTIYGKLKAKYMPSEFLAKSVKGIFFEKNLRLCREKLKKASCRKCLSFSEGHDKRG